MHPRITADSKLSLSPQEQRVATRWGHSELTVQEVADEMGISLRTAQSYLKIVRSKYKARGIVTNNRTRLHLALVRDQI